MATETERKFLVKGDFRKYASGSIEILQAYLTIDNTRTIRLRIADDKAYLTIKSRPFPGTISRNEWEIEIDVNDAREMLSICLPGRIEKTRYLVPDLPHTFEVDVFHGKNEGLIVAEIELENENDTFERPSWLGEEVTGQPQYNNTNLLK